MGRVGKAVFFRDFTDGQLGKRQIGTAPPEPRIQNILKDRKPHGSLEAAAQCRLVDMKTRTQILHRHGPVQMHLDILCHFLDQGIRTDGGPKLPVELPGRAEHRKQQRPGPAGPVPVGMVPQLALHDVKIGIEQTVKLFLHR